MKLQITTRQEHNITTLHCEIGVRYWEDASYYDPETDTWIDDNEDNPRIPCRIGETWCPDIDLNTNRILNWTPGVRYRTHYKCCDCFYCRLIGYTPDIMEYEGYDTPDIMEYEGYVPEGLGEDGDYVIWEIDEDGTIIGGFNFTQDTIDYMERNNLG